MKRTQTKHRTRASRFVVGACLLVAVAGAGWYAYTLIGGSETPQTVHTATSESPQETPKLSRFSEMPAQLKIDKIAVDAKIIPVGLTADGAMDAPTNLAEVGWYDQSAKAGEDAYAILLDGHHGVEQPGVFKRLHEIEQNDRIELITEHGTTLVYEVRETETVPYLEVDMYRALMPYQPGMQSLTIITCQGNYSSTTQTYDKRVVVYAERVS